MTHDRSITLSVAGTSKSLVWLPESTTWAAFVERLRVPVRGTETFTQYQRMTKAEQAKRKDTGGFVGGTLLSERRRKMDVTGRDLVTLDLDALPEGGVQQVTAKLDALGCAWVIYSTRSHQPARPRIRVIIPLADTVNTEEYEPIARKLAESINLLWCDPTTFQAERMMYWPSASQDAEYIHEYRDRPLLDGKRVLATYPDWRDVRSWPKVPGTSDEPRLTGSKKPDPTEKRGPIGAFNREYTITDAMAEFLPGVYTPVEDDAHRFTYAGGTTTGGAIVYDDNRYLCSHHASDPVGDRGVSAFDLVRIHRFGQDDEHAVPGTPVNRLPSYQKMCELAMALPAVFAAVQQERYDQATADFGTPPEDGGDVTWMSHLQTDPRTGKPAKTAPNVMGMLAGDPRLKGRIYKNIFSGQILGKAPLPWAMRQDEKEEFFWTDEDDSGLRIYTEALLGFRGTDLITDALRVHAATYGVHPIRDYLQQEAWDGIPRLDTLLIDYLGAQDTPYTRRVTRMMLVAAVARSMSERPVKFDTMCVLTGHQGAGKSTFIRKLAIHDLYTDGVTDFEGKNAAEIIQGKLFVEIAELSALYKTDINRVKTFLSQEADDYRAAYGRVVEHRPRRCVFWGTSNDFEYLSDPTGNRRFLPVDVLVRKPAKSIWDDLDREKQQIWAEAYARWQLGEPLYLTGEVALEAARQQELHNTPNTRDGIIRAFLERQVPDDWLQMDLSQRRLWLSSKTPQILPDGSEVELVPRDRVCAQEVFLECLNGDLKQMRNADVRDINRVIRSTGMWKDAPPSSNFGYCGRGRGFLRKSEAGQ